MTQSNIIKMMERVNETFISVTGHSISFIDSEGKSVLPFNMNIFSDFCKYVINSEKGRKKCMECNNILEHECQDITPKISKCYMGLTMITIPIAINGKCNYSITCGQMLMEGEQREFFEELCSKADILNLERDKLVEYGKRVKIVNQKDIATTMMFLSMLAEYISITETQLEMNKRYTRQLEDKIKLEKNLRETQFKFLQSQISPHFLFNTLNLVARVASNEKAEKTADLIYSLSELLRRSYKTPQCSCTLGEEFRHIESYLAIQNVRYSGLLKVEAYIDKQVENVAVPMFSFQPFVENAIIHGIEPIDREGYISISATKKGDKALIRVIDNGAGMEQKTVEMVLKGRIEPSRVQSSGMGIKNVMERLNLFFGDNYQIRIESGIDKGTEINILIPLSLKGANKNAQNFDC